MEKSIDHLLISLNKLVGLHRKMLETVRAEHELLIAVNIEKIQEITHAKEVLINSIQNAEKERFRALGELRIAWKKRLEDLTLSNVIIQIQGDDPKKASQLRSIYNTLKILVERIQVQQLQNKILVEKSIEHVNVMKQNALGSRNVRSQTYSNKGKSVGSNQEQARIFQEKV